jgi:hypothetical protein
MTDLLRQAYELASKLPPDKQDEIAELITLYLLARSRRKV